MSNSEYRTLIPPDPRRSGGVLLNHLQIALGKVVLVIGGVTDARGALLDNAFNHPQFFTAYGDDFSNLSDFLNDGVADNGTTGVLGGGSIANVEGFATGRVFRLGIRATF